MIFSGVRNGRNSKEPKVTSFQRSRIWNSGDGSLVQCLEGPSKARQSRFNGCKALDKTCRKWNGYFGIRKVLCPVVGSCGSGGAESDHVMKTWLRKTSSLLDEGSLDFCFSVSHLQKWHSGKALTQVMPFWQGQTTPWLGCGGHRLAKSCRSLRVMLRVDASAPARQYFQRSKLIS